MTTLADALVTSINTNYSGGGGGGVKPANIINQVDYKQALPLRPGSEYIVVWRPYPSFRNQRNAGYATVTDELRIYIQTPTSDDRLKEIKDEVISVVGANVITGVNFQFVTQEEDMTERRVPIFATELTAKFFLVGVSSAVNFFATASSHNHDDRYYTEAEVDALVGKFCFKTITGITNDVVADALEDTLTLASANSLLSIVGTTATDTITFTINQSSIDHDDLTNFTQTEHFTMLDQDDMADNDATKAATQQSIKAYVDSQVGSENELNEMNDVVLAGPATNDILVYHAVDSSWHDLTLSEWITQMGNLPDLTMASGSDIIIVDDTAEVFKIRQGANTYLCITTTDGAEALNIGCGGTGVAGFTTTGFNLLSGKVLSFTDGGSVDIIRDEDNFASDDANALATQQSIKKYTDDMNDTDIATHTAVAAAHHARYTDGEALAQAATLISDAAYAAGWDTVTTYAPSKNAVYDKIAAMDILIAANTTTAEVEAIIDAEIVNGQSIDNAIDALITTHTAIAAAHHARYADAEAVTAVKAENPLTLTNDLVVSGGKISTGTDTDGIFHGAANDIGIYHNGTDSYLLNTTGDLKILCNGDDILLDSQDDIVFSVNNGDTILTLDGGTGVATFTGNIAVGGTVDGVDIAARDHAKYDSSDLETDLGITVAKLLDLEMYGSANATWVPCIYENYVGQRPDGGSAAYRNVDGTDCSWVFRLPLPTLKGSLKLYVNGISVGVNDADADDYVDLTRAFGVNYSGSIITQLYSDTTNLTSQDLWKSDDELSAWGAASDCSGYESVTVILTLITTTDYELDLSTISLKCYYA